MGTAMTRREKLIAKIVKRPSEADATDVRAVLEDFGWTFRHQTGSHMTFAKLGERSLSIPLVSGRRVKRIYLDQICQRLGLDDLDDSDRKRRHS
jgi:predicted RNA binding protein YcfA (HicA-like mRNA interferase family)